MELGSPGAGFYGSTFSPSLSPTGSYAKMGARCVTVCVRRVSGEYPVTPACASGKSIGQLESLPLAEYAALARPGRQRPAGAGAPDFLAGNDASREGRFE